MFNACCERASILYSRYWWNVLYFSSILLKQTVQGMCADRWQIKEKIGGSVMLWKAFLYFASLIELHTGNWLQIHTTLLTDHFYPMMKHFYSIIMGVVPYSPLSPQIPLPFNIIWLPVSYPCLLAFWHHAFFTSTSCSFPLPHHVPLSVYIMSLYPSTPCLSALQHNVPPCFHIMLQIFYIMFLYPSTPCHYALLNHVPPPFPAMSLTMSFTMSLCPSTPWTSPILHH